MKLENIEDARILIARRSTLLDVLEKSQKWSNGHFEFTEHCGDRPDRISLSCFDELKEKMLELVNDELKVIEAKLTEM